MNNNNNPRRRLEEVVDSDEEIFEDETEQILGNDSEEENVEGEELIGDNMDRDYRPIPELDVYEEAGLDDDSNLEELSQSGRAAAEDELNRRDRADTVAAGGMRRGFIPDIFAEDSSDVGASRHRRRAEQIANQGYGTDMLGDSQLCEEIENLEDCMGKPVPQWVRQPSTRHTVKSKFTTFLRTFTSDEGKSVYSERIRIMAQRNERSVTVDYEHLVDCEQVLAYFLPEAPHEMLDIFDEVATEMTLARYPRYKQISDRIHVRVSHLPLIEELRSLRQVHLNQLIRTAGVVSSCTNVLPQLSLVRYDCVKCRCIIGPFSRLNEIHADIRPSSCPDCQSSGPFEINSEKTVYKNYQRVKIQESPGTVPAGRLPRSKDAILLDDLVDSCKPGDEVDITATYTFYFDRSLNNKQGFPVFSTHLLVNNITKKDEHLILSGLTDDDIKIIQTLAKDERIVERIVRSIAPSIYGHENIKQAIALSLFGGVPKVRGQRLRGDINVLLCGDPGTAKSQFLKFIEQLAPRCIYTTGQGASAVGLTAYVTKSPTTKEWTLEAGALVLADKGVCLIDEFDKMNEQDRTSIHEAMEQQSISISKAGIVSSLQARTTIIAAANPIGGRYDTSRNFTDNVELSSPILSRFDILCVVRDVVDPVQDEMLSRYVLGSHMRHHPRLAADEKAEIVAKLKETGAMYGGGSGGENEVEPIPLDLLKKYIIYAKQKVSPSLNTTNEHKLTSTYVDLRRASQESGGVDVTVRYFESMIRLAEAHAKMHLREVVVDDDVNMAIRVLLESFISTEKYSVSKQLENRFKSHLHYKKNEDELLMYLLRQLIHEKKTVLRAMNGGERTGVTVIEVREQDLRDRAQRLNIVNIAPFLKCGILAENKCYYDGGRKVIGHRY